MEAREALTLRALCGLKTAEIVVRTRSRPPLAAPHDEAGTAAEVDWRQIVLLYDILANLTPGPIVELNPAVAVGMAFGYRAGLTAMDSPTIASPLVSFVSSTRPGPTSSGVSESARRRRTPTFARSNWSKTRSNGATCSGDLPNWMAKTRTDSASRRASFGEQRRIAR